MSNEARVSRTEQTETPHQGPPASAQDNKRLPDAADQQQLVELYTESATPLTAMLRRAFGDGPPDPDDIAQLAFQKLLERQDLSDIRNLRAFLWRTARNLVFKAKRSQDVRARNDSEYEQRFFRSTGDDLDPERVISAKEQIKIVNEALRAMPERRRRAFVLHRIDGLSIAATARQLKIGPTAAGKHISRASEQIDEALSRTASVAGNEPTGPTRRSQHPPGRP